MGIEQFVVVQISRQSQGVTKAGFGIPLILGPAAVFSGIRSYSSLTAVAADFATSTDEYKMAQAIFSQTPRPEKVKIRDISTPVAQVSRITISTVSNNATYTASVNGQSVSFLSDGSATDAEIQAGLIAAINALTDPVTATANGTDKVDITADNAGEPFTLSSADAKLTLSTITASVGIADDILAAMQDPDKDWYELLTANTDDVTIKQAAATIEGLRRIYQVRNGTTAIKQSGSSDIASFLKNKGYFRSGIFFHGVSGEYPDAALAGRVLPLDAGSETWAFKNLSGITPPALTDAEKANLDGKNVTYYVETAGLKHTVNGKVAGDDYFDIIRGVDFMQARMEEEVFTLLVTLDKIPYTDEGVALVENAMRKVLELCKRQGIVDSYTITVPLVANISQADKADRLLPDVEFTAVLQGAVHKINIQGVVTL